jgi:hypothetical protein
MIFECEEVQVTRADGSLEATGVEWTEARVVVEAILCWIAKGLLMIGFVAGLVAPVAGITVGEKGFVPIAVLAGLALASGFGTAWSSARTEGKRRRILFHADGSISSTQDGRWRTTTADIRSIESVQLHQKKKEDDFDYTHGVRIITRRGRVLRVANNIEPDDATTLAVLLSEAVEAVRYPQASASTSGQPVAVW